MIKNSYSYYAYSEMSDSLFDIKIKSGGHIFAKDGRRISRPDGRDDWLLFYVAKGIERFSLPGESSAPAGSFIFFKPGEPQEHIYTGKATGEFYYVHFTAPANFQLFGFESSKIYKTHPSLKLNELFEEIIKELQTREIYYEKICVSHFFEISCLLLRKCNQKLERNKKHTSEISSVIQMINKEYSANYSLSDYAEIARMSKFYFLREFKNITGYSPLEYRAKIRLEHASEMLIESNMPICEIATELGYSSQNYFSDAFKRHYGISPTEYRKNST